MSETKMPLLAKQLSREYNFSSEEDRNQAMRMAVEIFGSRSFNQLTAAQLERLAILSEELGEAQQAIGKILRHGYESFNPDFPNRLGGNRIDLEKELGDVTFAIALLTNANDVSAGAILGHSRAKAVKIKPYLHHQNGE